jgi:hypothetical protein
MHHRPWCSRRLKSVGTLCSVALYCKKTSPKILASWYHKIWYHVPKTTIITFTAVRTSNLNVYLLQTKIHFHTYKSTVPTLISNQITNYKEHRPSWEANRSSDNHEILSILEDSKVHHCPVFTKHATGPFPGPDEPAPCHTFLLQQNQFDHSNCNRSHTWSLSFRFSHWNPVCISMFSHECQCPIHIILNLIILSMFGKNHEAPHENFLHPPFFLPLVLKYSRQNHVLSESQFIFFP